MKLRNEQRLLLRDIYSYILPTYRYSPFFVVVHASYLLFFVPPLHPTKRADVTTSRDVALPPGLPRAQVTRLPDITYYKNASSADYKVIIINLTKLLLQHTHHMGSSNCLISQWQKKRPPYISWTWERPWESADKAGKYQI